MQIYNVSDVPRNNINIAVYGNSGVGKTFFAGGVADVPEMCPVLIVNVNSGLITLSHRNDIDVTNVETKKDMDDVIAELQKGTKYKAVILDDLTDLQTIIINYVMVNGPADRKSPLDTYQIDYVRAGNIMHKYMRTLCALPFCTIFTTTTKNVYEDKERTIVTEIIPDLTDSVSRKLMKIVDYVWYICIRKHKTTGERQRVLVAQPSGKIHAKTRGIVAAEAIGNEMFNPTMLALVEKIKGATHGA